MIQTLSSEVAKVLQIYSRISKGQSIFHFPFSGFTQGPFIVSQSRRRKAKTEAIASTLTEQKH